MVKVICPKCIVIREVDSLSVAETHNERRHDRSIAGPVEEIDESDLPSLSKIPSNEREEWKDLFDKYDKEEKTRSFSTDQNKDQEVTNPCKFCGGQLEIDPRSSGTGMTRCTQCGRRERQTGG